MAEILRGEAAAEGIMRDLTARAERLRERGIRPCLAILRVGERPSDMAYERAAVKRCGRLGIRTKYIRLAADCTQSELEAAVRGINADDTVHGCLMFRPLPKHLNEGAACEMLSPEKDVDGMTALSLTGVFIERGGGFPPCTAQSCMELLDHYGIDPAGKNVTVIGRSLVIGRPLSMLLLSRNASVTICHSRSAELPEICRRADILVAAAGKPDLVGPDFVHPDQVVVDVGINPRTDGGICGDVQYDAVAPLVRAISPVPGGVGSVTAAVLVKHVIEAAERSAR